MLCYECCTIHLTNTSLQLKGYLEPNAGLAHHMTTATQNLQSLHNRPTYSNSLGCAPFLFRRPAVRQAVKIVQRSYLSSTSIHTASLKQCPVINLLISLESHHTLKFPKPALTEYFSAHLCAILDRKDASPSRETSPRVCDGLG